MASSHAVTSVDRCHAVWEGPLGTVVLLESASASAVHADAHPTPSLDGVFFHDQKHAPVESLWGSAAPDSPLLREAIRQLHEYFEGERKEFDLPLSLRGTDFQQRVWAALQGIPSGQVRAYGDIARAVHSPGASQAVGQAVGRNPWAIIVPCHRVLGSRGAVTGYAGGVDRKLALLKREGVHL